MNVAKRGSAANSCFGIVLVDPLRPLRRKAKLLDAIQAH